MTLDLVSFSRRRLLRGIAAGGGLAITPALLAACGGEDDDDDGGSAGATQPAASSSNGAPAGTLVIGGLARMESEHMVTAIRRPPSYHSTVAGRLFRGLTYIDPTNDFKAVPDMASEVNVSGDGLTYTAKLRNGITWHDGKPFTADDVKFTVDMIMKPENKAQSRVEFTLLDTVRVVDPSTVEFKLKSAFAPFMNSLSLDIMPKHILESQDLLTGEFAQGKVVGTGAYRLTNWRRGEFIEMEHYPEFYGAKPKIAKVIIRYFSDPSGLVAAVKTGEIHVAELTAPQVAAAGAADKFATARMRSVSPNGLAFNMKNPLFADPRVRIALNQAVDRKAVIDAIYGGNGTAAHGPFPNTPFDNSAVPPFAYDLAQVDKLMSEAGWTKSNGTWARGSETFKFTIFAPGFFIDGAEIISGQLKKAGFDTSVDSSKDYSYIFTNLGSVPAVTYNFGAPADPDSAYLALHSSASIEKGGFVLFYANAAVDRAMDKGRVTLDLAGRKAAYNEAQVEVRKDPPYLFVVAQDYLILVDRRVTGWKDNLFGLGLSMFTGNLESWSLQA